MREIKFRAWDESNEVMHNNVEFIRSDTDGNGWIIFKSDKQTLEDKKVFDNPYFERQLKIMQFTGLRDKNGKEIYEGDILRHEAWDPEYDTTTIEIGSIVWEKSTARFTSNIGGQFIPNSRSEVIGNIYENLELLGRN